jgi:hypothetical protein
VLLCGVARNRTGKRWKLLKEVTSGNMSKNLKRCNSVLSIKSDLQRDGFDAVVTRHTKS